MTLCINSSGRALTSERPERSDGRPDVSARPPLVERQFRAAAQSIIDALCAEGVLCLVSDAELRGLLEPLDRLMGARVLDRFMSEWRALG